MKVKELLKTVNVAWSPAQQNPIYLAAGTAAQQLDTNSYSNASLELYSVNLADPGYDMELKASQASQYKFHKLLWSPLGLGGAPGPNQSGLIVGGCEGGHIQIYSAAKLLAKEDALMASLDKHNGTVRALDYNSFQANLLASAASESEILIWDLNNTTTPMTPGAKTQPFEDVHAVAWNKQVQHILASVLPSRCVIWDLRKNEPIIKLSDTQSRVRWNAMQWHPENATQLWLASEEDHAPMVQLWDLRYATSPTKSLTIHQRGILGLTWCPKDIDLMVSCGKDNKILCWNPNSTQPEGEILSEIANTVQWYSDVQWCPRNPALIASSSLDGNVTIYSVMGGSQQQVQTSNKIMDSFPGMDTFAQAPQATQTTHVVYSDLTKPPKWMGRPIGASFAFGGKLVTFSGSQIRISQVITEPDLVTNSQKLETTLSQGNFTDYCREKADQMPDQAGRFLWYFLKANFEANPRGEFLNLLGYQAEDMQAKLGKYIKKDIRTDKLAEQVDGINLDNGSAPLDNNALFDSIASDHKNKQEVKESGLKRNSFSINVGEDQEGLIAQAILTGNIEAAVELCMSSGRTTEAIIIAITGDSSLLSRTQLRFFEENLDKNPLLNLISALVTKDCASLVEQCELEAWKEALVAVLTHSHSQEQICKEATTLGERLQNEGSISKLQSAILCFICADNLDSVAECWQKIKKINRIQGSPQTAKSEIKDLQELIEIVMVMQKSVQYKGAMQKVDLSQRVETLLVNYGMLLANQGAFESALKYVSGSENEKVAELSQRLYYSLGLAKIPGNQQMNAQQNQQQNIYQNKYNQNQSTSFFTPPAPQTQQINYNSGFMQPEIARSNQFNTNPMAPPPSLMNPVMNPVPSQQVPAAVPPPLDHPARPSSVGSASGGSGLMAGGRSKYLLDPSVQSGPNYGQPVGNYFNPAPINQTPAPMAPPAQMFNPVQQQPQFNTAPMNPLGFVDPMTQQQPQMQPPPQICKNPTPPPGWNDPPAPTRQKPKQPPAPIASDPITHPLFGVDPSPQPMVPGMMMGQQPVQGYGQPQSTMTPFSPNPVPMPGQPMGMVPPQPQQQQQQFMPQQQHFQQQQQQQYQPPQPPTPEPPPQKAPLPEEFVYLQTVFNELRQQCSQTAVNPQMKRKLDDVSKRLESLYDLLRENRLTPNTLQSLNQLVQYVQVGDYANGLALHTQMCSGPDFAQLASFMPGIKVLLQTALQLQVYLR